MVSYRYEVAPWPPTPFDAAVGYRFLVGTPCPPLVTVVEGGPVDRYGM